MKKKEKLCGPLEVDAARAAALALSRVSRLRTENGHYYYAGRQISSSISNVFAIAAAVNLN